jgi:hypothetical protein
VSVQHVAGPAELARLNWTGVPPPKFFQPVPMAPGLCLPGRQARPGAAPLSVERWFARVWPGQQCLA